MYCGRFAPSPTGALHAGSLVAALASYLDATEHGGRWLLRIDDADLTRVQPTAAHTIQAQLRHYGMVWHGEVSYTQDNRDLHSAALAQLTQAGYTYACGCTRSRLLGVPASSSGERVYDGRCAQRMIAPADIRAIRLKIPHGAPHVQFTDRWAGAQQQDVAREVGDFVLWRPEHVTQIAGGLYNYQLTMPVDDAAAGVTHVVRGADLLGNTARQLTVYDLLGLSRPSYLHVPLVLANDGAKLSKQHGAAPLSYLPSTDPIPVLNQALQHLGCTPSTAVNITAFWHDACAAWTQRLKQLPV